MEYIDPESKAPQQIGILTLQGVNFTGENPAEIVGIIKDSDKGEWVKIHIPLDEFSDGLTIFDKRKSVMGLCKQYMADKRPAILEQLNKTFNTTAIVVFMPNKNYRLALSDPTSGDKPETYLLIARVDTVEGEDIMGNEITHFKTPAIHGKTTTLYLVCPRPGFRSGIPVFSYLNQSQNRGECWFFRYEGVKRYVWDQDANLLEAIEKAKPTPPPTPVSPPVTTATPTFIPQFSNEELNKFSMDLLVHKFGPMYGLAEEELAKIEKKGDLVAKISLAIEKFFRPSAPEPTKPPSTTSQPETTTKMKVALEAALNGNGNDKKNNGGSLLDKFNAECPPECSKKTMSKWAKSQGLGDIATKDRGKRDVRAEVIAKIAAEKAKKEKEEEKPVEKAVPLLEKVEEDKKNEGKEEKKEETK